MKIIRPVDITDSKVTFLNVPEAEYTEWTSAETVSINDIRQVTTDAEAATATHKYYTAVTATSGNDPTIDDGTNWTETGTTNAWKQFDEVLQSQTQISYADGHVDLPGASGDYVSSPDSAAASITGDIDIRAKVLMSDYTPASAEQVFVAKYAGAGLRSYYFAILSGGSLLLTVTEDGSTGIPLTSTATVTNTDAEIAHFRVTLDVDNGAGDSDCTFYTSVDGETWVQLGDVVNSGGTISIDDNASLLNIGARTNGADRPLNGSIYQAQIYNGIDGTLAVDFDGNDHVSGSTLTSSTTGEVWTANGNATFVSLIPGIVTDILPGSIANSIALINCDGKSARAVMTDPIDGVVYDETKSLISTSGITDWYGYFYEAIKRQEDVVFFGMPSFPLATVRVYVNDDTLAKCGELVLGKEFVIGDSQNGASWSIVDYSVKNVDSVTGQVTITPGANKKIADINVITQTPRFTEIQGVLTDTLNQPIVWVPEESIEGTFIYGYYRNFRNIISGPVVSSTLLQLESLS